MYLYLQVNFCPHQCRSFSSESITCISHNAWHESPKSLKSQSLGRQTYTLSHITHIDTLCIRTKRISLTPISAPSGVYKPARANPAWTDRIEKKSYRRHTWILGSGKHPLKNKKWETHANPKKIDGTWTQNPQDKVCTKDSCRSESQLRLCGLDLAPGLLTRV